jgi:AbrB family looped-hinge helix DNA binding protein
MKNTTTLQKDGGLVIPKHILKAMELNVGDKVNIIVAEDGKIRIRKADK